MERLKNVVYLIAFVVLIGIISSFTAPPEVDDNTPLQSETHSIEISAMTIPEEPTEEVTVDPSTVEETTEEVTEETTEEATEESEPSTEDEPSEKDEPVLEEVAEEDIADTDEGSTIEYDVSLEDERTTERLLGEALYLIGDISYDPATKTYTLTPTQPALIRDIDAALEGGLHEEWAEITYGIMDVSYSVMGALSPGYTISMVHPDTGEVLFSAKDGAAIYDIRNED